MKFKNYKNQYSNDSRIYSQNDIRDMSIKDAFGKQKELLSQNRAIGIPTFDELESSSNVIWVDAYVKDDGTEVRGHWRSKPESGFSGGAASVENSDFVIQDPDKIAGVKKGKPMSFEEATSTHINPNIEKEDNSGYIDNCQSCVVAYEARRRGYNVQAKEAYIDQKSKVTELSYLPFEAWIDTKNKTVCEPETTKALNVQDLIRELDEYVKSDSRNVLAMYQIRNLDDDIIIRGHIVTIEREANQKLRIYDPQNNRIIKQDDFIEYLNFRSDFSGEFPTQILRVDDKVFSPYFIHHVVSPM